MLSIRRPKVQAPRESVTGYELFEVVYGNASITDKSVMKSDFSATTGPDSSVWPGSGAARSAVPRPQPMTPSRMTETMYFTENRVTVHLLASLVGAQCYQPPHLHSSRADGCSRY